MRVLDLLRTIRRQRRGERVLPSFLTYTVTFKCNARCVMCDSWKIPSPDDLELGEVERIFRQLPRMDVVRLTGGEPFVRKDLAEVAELARVHLDPFVLHVTTNAFLTDRIVRFCEERARDRQLAVLVSVDGLGRKHDEVRGRDGAWERTIETVRALAPRRKQLRIQLAVNQVVVDDEGAEHYRLLREELRPLGVRNQVVFAYDQSATYSVERGIDVAPTEEGQFKLFGDLSREAIESLIEELEADLPSYPLPERIPRRYYLDGIRARLLEGRGAPNPRCVALTSHLRLFPNGDVPTCQFNSYVAGNLREQSFEEVWASARTERQREWVRRCPGCWAECEVVPSAVYTGDLARHAASPRRRRAAKARAARG